MENFLGSITSRCSENEPFCCIVVRKKKNRKHVRSIGHSAVCLVNPIQTGEGGCGGAFGACANFEDS